MLTTPAVLGDPLLCVGLVTRLIGVAALFVSLERLGNWRDYGRTGAQGWHVLRERSSRRATSAAARFVFEQPACLAMLGLGAAAAAGLILDPARPSVTGSCLAVCWLSSAWFQIRNVDLGVSIMDRAMTLVLGALLVRMVAPDSRTAAAAALAFIATNSCLAYAKSAMFKLGDPSWRAGTQLFHVFNNRRNDTRWIAVLLDRHQGVTRLATWSVVAIELTFPASLVLGYPLCLVLPALAATMHVANAATLGLRGFTWTFGATYPAIVFVADRLQTLLGRA